MLKAKKTMLDSALQCCCDLPVIALWFQLSDPPEPCWAAMLGTLPQSKHSATSSPDCTSLPVLQNTFSKSCHQPDLFGSDAVQWLQT